MDLGDLIRQDFLHTSKPELDDELTHLLRQVPDRLRLDQERPRHRIARLRGF